MHGTRSVQAPRGFALWLLFLLCTVLGVAVLSLTAPGTIPSPVSNRVVAYLDRTATYLALTVLLLYAGNLTEQELPRQRLAWMLGLVAIYATIGGVAGMLMPHLHFTSPIELLLPHSLRANASISAVVHPALAEVQNVFGDTTARPKAPFDYTNVWGNSVIVLMPWLIVGWWSDAPRRRRLLSCATVACASVVLVYTLNRGAWGAALLSAAVVALRLAATRRREAVAAICVGLALLGVVLLSTPAGGIVANRLAHSPDTNTRTVLARLAITDALSSPVVGYGDTRKETATSPSITVGATPKCPLCGPVEVGSTGQLWMVLICSGIVGAIFYVGFFIVGAFAYWRDRSAYGLAGIAVLIAMFVCMFTYVAVGAPLAFTMLAYALLWRNDTQIRTGQSRAWGVRSMPPRRLAAETPG
jgi:hypothetical protein